MFVFWGARAASSVYAFCAISPLGFRMIGIQIREVDAETHHWRSILETCAFMNPWDESEKFFRN